MHLSETLLLALAAVPAAHASLYSKKSPVLQVDGKSYKSLIASSNYTSIVEFYAPWCGHCKNLAPDYQKVASRLNGLANVAAVNCDEESNKAFCGSMGVQGFPTLKIVKPGKKKGKPSVSDYQGPRSAKDIIEAVESKMPNHVTRVKEANLDQWLQSDAGRPKALIVGEKGLVPSLAKALAIDFLGAINVGYARNTDKSIVSKYAISSFPTVIILEESKDAITYDGEINKSALVDFLSQAALPNPGALKPNASAKSAKKETKSKSKKESSKEEDKTDSTSSEPSEPETQAPAEPVVRKLQLLEDESALQTSCLHSKASTCVLTIVPDAEAPAALALGDISHKYKTRGAKMFPIYAVPQSNDAAQTLLKTLKLEATADKPLVLAVNAKRSWYSAFEGDALEQSALEKWIDGIRLGDMKKEVLPDVLVGPGQKETAKAEETVEHGEL